MSKPHVMVATICCDRKAYSLEGALNSISNLDPAMSDFSIYVNIETEDPMSERWQCLGPIHGGAGACGVGFDLDFWKFHSSWWKKPTFDQDQSRLLPICMARNMILMAAQRPQFTHVLMVDADVRVPEDSLTRLLAIDKPICGGVVPGRQHHKHVNYITRPNREYELNGRKMLEVDYSTCGFLMLRRDVYDFMRFRYGPSKFKKNDWLSEDPAFSEDCQRMGFGRWHIDTELVATHIDDPSNTDNTEPQF